VSTRWSTGPVFSKKASSAPRSQASKAAPLVRAQSADRLLQLAVVAPGRDHAGTACREPPHGFEPHARRAADHHHCLLFQSHVDSFECLMKKVPSG
jgi:hypothetical protein